MLKPLRLRVSSTAPAGLPVSLEDAMLKRLGLKLQIQKRPATVLVIDRLEEKPAEN